MCEKKLSYFFIPVYFTITCSKFKNNWELSTQKSKQLLTENANTA